MLSSKIISIIIAIVISAGTTVVVIIAIVIAIVRPADTAQIWLWLIPLFGFCIFSLLFAGGIGSLANSCRPTRKQRSR